MYIQDNAKLKKNISYSNKFTFTNKKNTFCQHNQYKREKNKKNLVLC